RPVTAEQLQAEMDRMAQNTRQPEVLHELFNALGNDPFVIAECLARPALAERLLTQGVLEQLKQTSQTYNRFVPATVTFILPIISDTSTGCIDDSWTATSSTNAPSDRFDHTAVWTGSQMIVWGGVNFIGFTFNTGGKYNPSTNTWTATTTANAPATRTGHTAVWTGSEMIIWGGWNGLSSLFNSGGKYNPVTDSWTDTSTSNAPSGRYGHTAVWTGSEMIVWGGVNNVGNALGDGGRYCGQGTNGDPTP